MNNKKTVTRTGVGIVDIIQVVFIILKLCKLIDWPWWVVLSPLWGGAAFAILCFAIAGLCYYLIEKLD